MANDLYPFGPVLPPPRKYTVPDPWYGTGQWESLGEGTEKPPPMRGRFRFPQTLEIDPLVRGIMEAESGGKANALGKAGEVGPMQLMPSTAKMLGVKDINNPEENIAAGTKYINQMLKKYGGDQEKALAAYNAGPGRMDGLLKKYGPEWKAHLPSTTKAYIEKVQGYAGASPRTAPGTTPPSLEEMQKSPAWTALSPEDQQRAIQEYHVHHASAAAATHGVSEPLIQGMIQAHRENPPNAFGGKTPLPSPLETASSSIVTPPTSSPIVEEKPPDFISGMLVGGATPSEDTAPSPFSSASYWQKARSLPQEYLNALPGLTRMLGMTYGIPGAIVSDFVAQAEEMGTGQRPVGAFSLRSPAASAVIAKIPGGQTFLSRLGQMVAIPFAQHGIEEGRLPTGRELGESAILGTMLGAFGGLEKRPRGGTTPGQWPGPPTTPPGQSVQYPSQPQTGTLPPLPRASSPATPPQPSQGLKGPAFQPLPASPSPTPHATGPIIIPSDVYGVEARAGKPFVPVGSSPFSAAVKKEVRKLEQELAQVPASRTERQGRIKRKIVTLEKVEDEHARGVSPSTQFLDAYPYLKIAAQSPQKKSPEITNTPIVEVPKLQTPPLPTSAVLSSPETSKFSPKSTPPPTESALPYIPGESAQLSSFNYPEQAGPPRLTPEQIPRWGTPDYELRPNLEWKPKGPSKEVKYKPGQPYGPSDFAYPEAAGPPRPTEAQKPPWETPTAKETWTTPTATMPWEKPTMQQQWETPQTQLRGYALEGPKSSPEPVPLPRVEETIPPSAIKVYHGTDESFEQFNPQKIGSRTDPGFAGRGAYVTLDPEKAGRWGKHVLSTEIRGGKWLEINGQSDLYKNGLLQPLSPEESQLPQAEIKRRFAGKVNAMTDKLIAEGYDGIRWNMSSGDTQYTLFHPEKYKFSQEPVVPPPTPSKKTPSSPAFPPIADQIKELLASNDPLTRKQRATLEKVVKEKGLSDQDLKRAAAEIILEKKPISPPSKSPSTKPTETVTLPVKEGVKMKYAVYAHNMGDQQVRIIVDKNGQVIAGTGRHSSPELYGDDLRGKNIKDLPNFKKQRYTAAQSEVDDWNEGTSDSPPRMEEERIVQRTNDLVPFPHGPVNLKKGFGENHMEQGDLASNGHYLINQKNLPLKAQEQITKSKTPTSKNVTQKDGREMWDSAIKEAGIEVRPVGTLPHFRQGEPGTLYFVDAEGKNVVAMNAEYAKFIYRYLSPDTVKMGPDNTLPLVFFKNNEPVAVAMPKGQMGGGPSVRPEASDIHGPTAASKLPGLPPKKKTP